MKLTKDQAAVVESLADQGLPREYAILIALRADSHWVKVTHYNPYEYLISAFCWSEQPEKHDFWNGMYEAIKDELHIGTNG